MRADTRCRNDQTAKSAPAAENHGTGLGIPNSLFGRNNSLFREHQGIACKLLKLLKDSTLVQTAGNALQPLEIAGRIDAGQRRIDRKFRTFPVIFAVIRELGTPRSGHPAAKETPMTETPDPSITRQLVGTLAGHE
jgi:hypothetical protein